jgi:hypothetical protein
VLDAMFAGDGLINLARQTGELERSHFVACRILGFFFGLRWLTDHVAGNAGAFLEDWSDLPARMRTAQRTVELAEMLLNLQPIKGVEAVFDQVACGQVESAYAELQAGTLLDHARTPFRYIWPANIKREDFDIELEFRCGWRGCADVKAKLTSTKPSKATALDAMKKARAQLPETTFPGVVFLKLPHHWTTIENMCFVGDAMVEFLRNTRQVVSVVGFFAIEATDGKTITTTITSFEMLNDNHSFDADLDFRVLSDDMKPRDGWFDIRDFVRSKLGSKP